MVKKSILIAIMYLMTTFSLQSSVIALNIALKDSLQSTLTQDSVSQLSDKGEQPSTKNLFVYYLLKDIVFLIQVFFLYFFSWWCNRIVTRFFRNIGSQFLFILLIVFPIAIKLKGYPERSFGLKCVNKYGEDLSGVMLIVRFLWVFIIKVLIIILAKKALNVRINARRIGRISDQVLVAENRILERADLSTFAKNILLIRTTGVIMEQYIPGILKLMTIYIGMSIFIFLSRFLGVINVAKIGGIAGHPCSLTDKLLGVRLVRRKNVRSVKKSIAS